MFTRAASPGPANSAPYVFPDPRARDFYIDWDRAASDVVAILRSAAGRDPHDCDLSDLVGELSTQSDEFRTRWAAHNVRFHDTGTKEFHHPAVGDITTTYNRMDLAADPGLAITIYSADRSQQSHSASSEAGRHARAARAAEHRTSPLTAPQAASERHRIARTAASPRHKRKCRHPPRAPKQVQRLPRVGRTRFVRRASVVARSRLSLVNPWVEF
jgi:hypothetical protein